MLTGTEVFVSRFALFSRDDSSNCKAAGKGFGGLNMGGKRLAHRGTRPQQLKRQPTSEASAFSSEPISEARAFRAARNEDTAARASVSRSSIASRSSRLRVIRSGASSAA